MIGILAFGSLITNPGYEIKSILDHVIQDIPTPFPVEYARLSKSRDGAPTLVPMPYGVGIPVNAIVLVLKQYTHKEKALNFLYRREIRQEGNLKMIYEDLKQRKKKDAIIIDVLKNYYGITNVYYTIPKPNFIEILDVKRLQTEKACLLARAAINSVTLKTFKAKTDGIQYLAECMQSGVITELTNNYQKAVMALAGNTPNLYEARQFIAKNKGFIL